jgi:hypothetical protein
MTALDKARLGEAAGADVGPQGPLQRRLCRPANQEGWISLPTSKQHRGLRLLPGSEHAGATLHCPAVCSSPRRTSGSAGPGARGPSRHASTPDDDDDDDDGTCCHGDTVSQPRPACHLSLVSMTFTDLDGVAVKLGVCAQVWEGGVVEGADPEVDARPQLVQHLHDKEAGRGWRWWWLMLHDSYLMVSGGRWRRPRRI